MTSIWEGLRGAEVGCGWCAYHDAHGQTVLELVAVAEALPDLVDAAMPHGIRVWIWAGEQALETRLGRGGAGRGWAGVRGGSEPAGTTGGVVVGTRWGQRMSHIEKVFRTVCGEFTPTHRTQRLRTSDGHETTRLPTLVSSAVDDVPLRQRRRRPS